MGFYTANNVQTIAPNGSVVFDTVAIKDTTGKIKFTEGSSVFGLSGGANKRNICPCCNNTPCKQFPINFGANIAIPTGGTAGEISIAFAVNGATVPVSTMIATPAAVEEFRNVSCEIPVPIWCGCCQYVTVVNLSDQPILMKNAHIEILGDKLQ